MTPKSYKREREKRGTQARVASLLGVSRVAVAWLRHAQDEALDLAGCLERLIWDKEKNQK